MLFYIGLNFLATLKLIELQLDVFKTRLEAIQVEKYFETEGLRVDNLEYLKAPNNWHLLKPCYIVNDQWDKFLLLLFLLCP